MNFAVASVVSDPPAPWVKIRDRAGGFSGLASSHSKIQWIGFGANGTSKESWRILLGPQPNKRDRV